MNGRERVLAAMRGEPRDRLAVMPITMMFAADQVGALYRRYATDHRVLVEAQLRTAERFGFDHVSVISDPAREAADCGAAVRYFDDQPPTIEEEDPLLADKARLATLRPPSPDAGPRMSDRLAATAMLRDRVGDDLAVEGWVEGPCAEGADLRGLNPLMMDLLDDPPFVRDLFELTLQMSIDFARFQVDAGADLIGVGDAAASLVGPDLYREFVWPYEKRLVDAIHAMGSRVRLHICGNTRSILGAIGELGCDIVDLDAFAPVSDARAAMGPRQVLLGYLDPVRTIRNGTPEGIDAALAACHAAAGDAFIIGAGCELPRDSPHENVAALARYAQQHPLSPPVPPDAPPTLQKA